MQFFIDRICRSIDLDNEPPLAASEIGNLVANRLLADEFEIAKLAIAEFGPKLRFGIGRLTAKSSCNRNCPFDWDHALDEITTMRLAGHLADFGNKGPGAPHPPNARALGPSLSPLTRGEVYARLPTDSAARMCESDNGESRDPFLRVTDLRREMRTWTSLGPGFRRYRIHTSLRASSVIAYTPLPASRARGVRAALGRDMADQRCVHTIAAVAGMTKLSE